MSEWMKVMLEEIDRKHEEAREDSDEAARRGQQPAKRPAPTDDSTS